MITFPAIKCTTDNKTVNTAFRLAMGDVFGNIVPFKDGILTERVPCIMAGLDYDLPWTRDASINTWNALGLLSPDVARNTLYSVLTEDKDAGLRIDGQYWDAIIWATGAWHFYLYTGEKDFLTKAYTAVANSLRYFEERVWCEEHNLFAGIACYGDGISAYPDEHLERYDPRRDDDTWPGCSPKSRVYTKKEVSMHVLSTNCLYYNGYRMAEAMARELGEDVKSEWGEKAERLRKSINDTFFDEAKGNYRYLIDDNLVCDYQEGMGIAFAIMFGVADEKQRESVFNNYYSAPAGIPCVWPTFPRYQSASEMEFGRHSGTVWPHILSFFATAAAQHGRSDVFEREFMTLAKHAVRDAQFTEIYHPITGEEYGGLQENAYGIWGEWHSVARNTWGPTGFLRMIFMGLIGMRFSPEGITFAPSMLASVGDVAIENFPYRGALLDITVKGTGKTVTSFTIDGRKEDVAFIPAMLTGKHTIACVLSA